MSAAGEVSVGRGIDAERGVEAAEGRVGAIADQDRPQSERVFRVVIWSDWGDCHVIQEMHALLDRYVAWLRDKTTLRQVGDWVEVSTPYLDRHNDYLLIYAKRVNGHYILTDDGFVLGDLEQSGCKLESPKRQSLLKMTLNGFGIQLNQGRLEVRASADDFAHKKHNLVQAMLAVNDMFYLAEPMLTCVNGEACRMARRDVPEVL